MSLSIDRSDDGERVLKPLHESGMSCAYIAHRGVNVTKALTNLMAHPGLFTVMITVISEVV